MLRVAWLRLAQTVLQPQFIQMFTSLTSLIAGTEQLHKTVCSLPPCTALAGALTHRQLTHCSTRAAGVHPQLWQPAQPHSPAWNEGPMLCSALRLAGLPRWKVWCVVFSFGTPLIRSLTMHCEAENPRLLQNQELSAAQRPELSWTETRRSAYLHTSVFRSMYSNWHGSSLGVSYWGYELWTEVQHFTNTDTGFKGLPTIMLIWCFPESWALKTTNLKFYSSFFWILPFFCFTCLGKQLKAHQCEAPSAQPSEALLKQHCPTMLTAQTPSAPLTVQLCTTFTWLSPGTLPSNDKI